MPNPGSTTARGYGHQHQKLRAQWKPIVDAGEAYCSSQTCLNPDGTGRWIMPGRPWDLGHTDDRTNWTSPEHSTCNRSDGARRRNAGYRRHGAEQQPARPALPTSEDWWG